MSRASLTAIGFCVIFALLSLGFVLDAISQFHSSGRYELPDYVQEYVKLALQFAFGGAVFAAIREATIKVKNEKTDKENRIGSGSDSSDQPLTLSGRGSKKKESSRD